MFAFNQDPRLLFAQTQFGGFPYSPVYNTGYNPLGIYGQPSYAPTTPYPYATQLAPATPFAYGAPISPVQTPIHTSGINQAPELAHLIARVEEIRYQLVSLQSIFQADLMRRSATEAHLQAYPQMFNQAQNLIPFQYQQNYANGTNLLPVRLRESDSHIFCDIYLPTLTIADVEVEVSGNRIICRTRVPVAPMARIWAAQLPRGVEVFDLPDGRIEFNWLVHTPIVAKDVEASFREGFLCICIPKTEVTTQRQTVKVTKETATGRRAEMNS